MKNKILYMTVLALAAFALAGCQKITTEGYTKVTQVPYIEIVGGDDIIMIGDTYVDTQGCRAEDAEGKDVTSQATSKNNIKARVGAYTVTYTIKNADGAPSHAYRTVYVVHPTAIANLYLAECTFGSLHFTGAPIFVTDTKTKDDNGNIIYEIDDMLGGLYFWGRYPGYEPTYDFHAEANVVINADNTVTQDGDAGDWYFASSSPVVLTGGTFDPATRTWDLNVTAGATAGKVILRAITK
jgi:predicted small secreted protein